jgi:hypothetical protein
MATTKGQPHGADWRQPCELIVSTSRGRRRLQLFELTSASICSQRLSEVHLEIFAGLHANTWPNKPGRLNIYPARSMHHGACVAVATTPTDCYRYHRLQYGHATVINDTQL